MRTAFLKKLEQLATNDDRLMFITADLGFGVFEEFESNHPRQYLNAGVAEQNMTGIAAGMALEGYKVFTYSIGNFATFRCIEQIRNDVCYHDLNVTVTTMGGGFSYGALGMSHHATEDIAIMRAMPNMTVVVPCSEFEAAAATEALNKEDKPGYLRLDKSKVMDGIDNGDFYLGKARVLEDGQDIAIIGVGGILEEALTAASKLSEVGISTKVVSMHTIQPIDGECLREIVESVKRIIVLEEHSVTGGLGSAIAEYCMEHGLHPKEYVNIGLRDGFSSVVGDQDYLREYYKLNSVFIVNTAKKMLGVIE